MNRSAGAPCSICRASAEEAAKERRTGRLPGDAARHAGSIARSASCNDAAANTVSGGAPSCAHGAATGASRLSEAARTIKRRRRIGTSIRAAADAGRATVIPDRQ